jgi:hypothetical protein
MRIRPFESGKCEGPIRTFLGLNPLIYLYIYNNANNNNNNIYIYVCVIYITV